MISIGCPWPFEKECRTSGSNGPEEGLKVVVAQGWQGNPPRSHSCFHATSRLRLPVEPWFLNVSWTLCKTRQIWGHALWALRTVHTKPLYTTGQPGNFLMAKLSSPLTKIMTMTSGSLAMIEIAEHLLMIMSPKCRPTKHAQTCSSCSSPTHQPYTTTFKHVRLRGDLRGSYFKYLHIDL